MQTIAARRNCLLLSAVAHADYIFTEVCYCIGLGLGIILFFNHVGRKKITPDPTPIQIEMRKYEKDVDTTFIENAGRGGHSIDVS